MTYTGYKTPQMGQGNWWDTANNVMGSPVTQAGIGALGGYLQQRGEDKRFDKELGLSQEQLALANRNATQSAYESLLNDQYRRASDVSQQRGIGESQKYLQNQALNSQLFGMLQQPSLPGNAQIQSAMGSYAQPMQVDPKLQELFSADNVLRGAQSAITQRDMDMVNVDPNAGFTDLGALGFDPNSKSFQSNTARRDAYGQEAQSRHGQMTGAILEQAQKSDAIEEAKRTGNWEAVYGPAPEGYEYDEETGALDKKGSSWWKKALAIGGAGVATALTGGLAAPALGAALGTTGGALATGALAGAAGGAVNSAVQGQNPLKGAAGGAMMGGLTGGMGAIPGAAKIPGIAGPVGAGGQGIGQRIGQQFKDPRFYLNALNYGMTR